MDTDRLLPDKANLAAPPYQYGGNQPIPNDDIHENTNQLQPAPTAPPIAHMDRVVGYDNMQFDNYAYPPPPAYEDVVGTLRQDQDFQPVVPAVSEETAREALVQYASSKCCYGTKAARQLVFNRITPSTAIHYRLETFTEGRQVAWSYEPYDGLPVDGPANGPAPMPWDIVVNTPHMFQDASREVEVPHTASVKMCHSCMGTCTKRCWRCHGRGNLICGHCTGGYRTVHRDGHHHREPCNMCFGSGRRRCWICNGTGLVSCETCHARGSLKCYIKMMVTWKNNIGDHVVERTALPDHLIKNVTGKIVFQAQHTQVAPLVSFSEQEINTASQRLTQQHASQFVGQRILQQRHFVKMVPVSEVDYSYNNKNYTFWVYGEENRVYEEDYPLKCCCGICTVL